MQNNVWEWIQSHGTLVLLGVVAIVVGILFLKKQPPTAAVSGVSPADLSGLTTDANGNPIVYRAVSDTFVTENISGSYNSAAQDATQSVNTSVNSTTVSHPVEHPIEPGPTPTPTPHLSDGLLGPNVAVDFSKRTYTSPSVKTPTPIPIPASDPLVQGSSNRVWYVDNGVQRLLTSGYGGPVSNDGVPAGNSSSSTTQSNSSYTSTVNTH